MPYVSIRDEDELAYWAGFGGKRQRHAFLEALFPQPARQFAQYLPVATLPSVA